MQTVLIIFGILLLTLGILFFIARARIRNIPLVADHEKIIKLTDKNFHHQTKNRIVLVDFWAAWCAPCRMMAPVLNEVAGELPDSSRVGKVDIEKYPVLAQKYKVRNIPTLILFKNAREIERYVGVKQKEFLVQKVLRA
jgi:thioredoxin 1